jgi:glycosyltransferase involved in cell wall biosynthesis
MADRHTPRKYMLKASQILKDEGLGSLYAKSLRKVAKKLSKSADNLQTASPGLAKRQFQSIVDKRDVLLADITNNVVGNSHIDNPTKVINWVISPPRSGGGHQNMFRFIEHLDKNGYQNNIYLYTTNDFMTVKEAEGNVSEYSTLAKAKFYYYDRSKQMKPADAIFATGWETAYPVLNEKTSSRKFYFVQDFEPLFYPVGTEYILAENTYRFGFRGITAGGWLAKKLSDEYGMECDSYDFGAEKNLYTYTNASGRNEVFFYARPVTERRAFDLGIMTLELFHKKHPEYIINLAGWDVDDYDIPFPYVNHKTLPLDQLSELYNKCSVGLVLSLTNMSLMPLELLASGVIPVVNEGDNNRLVSSNAYIHYAFPTPKELSDAMSEVAQRHDLAEYSEKAAKSVGENDWDSAKDKFIKIVEKEIYG